MLKLVRLALLATLPLLLLLAACGGDDDNEGGRATATGTADGPAETEEATPTDDSGDGAGGADYYNQVADILNQADRDSNDIAVQYGGPYDDAADEIEQTVAAFNETVAVFESVISSMSDLEPPANAEDAHNTYMANVASAVELFSAAAADFDDASTTEDITALQDQYGSSLNTASADLESNCLVLQDLADSAGSGADLGCSVQN